LPIGVTSFAATDLDHFCPFAVPCICLILVIRKYGSLP
jgi:hypothetical protein